MNRRHTRALTLVEMLVVMALIAMLASMVTVAVIHARRISVQVECQSNLRQIGQTLSATALSNNGLYPRLTGDPSLPVEKQVPWWALVYKQWEGAESARIDTESATAGVQAPEQLPALMRAFHCRAAAALDNSGATPTERGTNLGASLSYGMNFDVKCYPTGSQTALTATPYRAKTQSNDLDVAPASAVDRYEDQYTAAQIQHPSEFILLSEANTEGTDKTQWTGGRISMQAITRDAADTPPRNAPIVGRHSHMANVLFADQHVESLKAEFRIDDAGVVSPLAGVNRDTRLWTLPDEP